MKYVESLNRALHHLFEQDPDVFLIGEDLLDPYGGAFKVAKGLSERYPEQVFSTPISEAAITGFGIGMALAGKRPIVEIMFGDFVTLCVDQLVNGAAKLPHMYKDETPLPLTLRAPMGGRRGYGPTHSQSIESLFFNVPGLRIFAPSHLHDPGQLLIDAVTSNQADIFIENKILYASNVFPHSTFANFEVSKHDPQHLVSCAILDAPQVDVIIMGYGGMAPVALEALETLFVEHELFARFLCPAVIKPFDLSKVIDQIPDDVPVLVVEESPTEFGWAAEVVSQLCALRKGKNPGLRLGAKACPIPSAKTLEDKVLPNADDIVRSALMQF